ncbi:MAG: DUF1552 domain-containing protein [Roseibacillus sp.]|jgi:hypothetical protein|nr:hypothetical protein [Roseibacillus sp.]MCP4728959.1 DUF1552 domain-containing protein [Roseibacillus sp.]MDP7308807.1 DUF1552 domain-containing protein [Roseibacillus sp.]HJM63152.1 DUF1552 domain-containing protein [Roseibacillus sp.]|tara:strand:- start:19092 stop:20453 length:1362 start_codon:yes stop_codon:yes gene_type:complete
MSFPREQIGRRTFLRGLGACITLPGMTSLAGAATVAKAGSRGLTATGAPLRSAYLYVPNGVIMDKWRPEGFGTDFKFNESMAPLEPFRNDLQIVKGYAQVEGNPGKDGAGDHARANATFLTGARPLRTSGANLKVGISADQLAARFLAAETRLPSLELTSERVRNTGACDAGYSCAYQYNISWRSEHLPATPESNPRAVFERIYGSGNPEERAANAARRHAEQKSILDFVQDSARKMEQRLGREDREKFDEYLTGVREVEQRIERVERLGPPADPGRSAPDGTPRDYREHIRILFDMMLLAFQSDSTRVVSFLIGHDGSNRSFRNIGVSGGHHDLSHHGKDARKMELVSRIDRFYSEELAYFLERMKETRDADGKSLLHNSMVVWGSGLSDGHWHTHVDLPIVVAGNAGGKFQSGRHVDAGEAPLNNLFVRMLKEVGLPGVRFGDSTGAEKRV